MVPECQSQTRPEADKAQLAGKEEEGTVEAVLPSAQKQDSKGWARLHLQMPSNSRKTVSVPPAVILGWEEKPRREITCLEVSLIRDPS